MQRLVEIGSKVLLEEDEIVKNLQCFGNIQQANFDEIRLKKGFGSGEVKAI